MEIKRHNQNYTNEVRDQRKRSKMVKVYYRMKIHILSDCYIIPANTKLWPEYKFVFANNLEFDLFAFYF